MEKEGFGVIRSESKVFFSEVNPSHDWLHVKRVEKLAEELAERENANTEIVKISVLLHDTGRKKEDEGEIEEHASGEQRKQEISWRSMR